MQGSRDLEQFVQGRLRDAAVVELEVRDAGGLRGAEEYREVGVVAPHAHPESLQRREPHEEQHDLWLHPVDNADSGRAEFAEVAQTEWELGGKNVKAVEDGVGVGVQVGDSFGVGVEEWR